MNLRHFISAWNVDIYKSKSYQIYSSSCYKKLETDKAISLRLLAKCDIDDLCFHFLFLHTQHTNHYA